MSDLLTAAKYGYYNQVVSLLNCPSCDVNARDKDKATPLYWSASRGHAKICRELVRAGCDVNACVKWGSTALHAAADRGHADCLTVLLDSGADVQVQNERGDTALHLAAYRGYRDLVEVLVTRGRADPFLKNAQSKTPLQEAQSQQHTATAKALQHYMESLGCHPFKSLPMSETSSKQSSPQEQPSSSSPAQSWPRYQSFPKFPDPTPPTDLARPHTHPLLTNNLSQGAGSVDGSHHLLQGSSSSEAGSDFRLNQLTGIAGLKGLPGFTASHGDRLQPFHVHRDPQENVDEGVHWSKMQATEDFHREHHDRLSDLIGDQRYPGTHPRNGVGLNQLSDPSGGNFHSAHTGADTSPGGPSRHCTQASAGTVWRHPNVASKTYSYETDIQPPVMSPPKRQHQSFVKHEDLTLFAESLQLEVVKLRDSLSSKELQVAELEKLTSSLKTQNTHLQQVMVEKQNKHKETIATKESEIDDLTRRLRELERQNLCLQQAIVETQVSSSQTTAQKENQVQELTARISDLERLNTSLQQLLITQQETMKGVLASKDLEVAALRDRVETLSQKTSPSPVFSAGASSSSRDRSSELKQPHTPSDSHGSVADAGSGNQTPKKSDSPNTLAMISVCDPLVTIHHSVQTLQTESENILTLEASQTTEWGVTSPIPTVTLSAGSPPVVTSSCLKPRCLSDGHLQCHLRATVSRLFQDPSDTGKLDADGREWTPGREFQLLDPKPVNCGSDGERRGSCSLVFSIQHQGRKYMLKMLTNLINLSYEAHSQGRSLDAHLLHCFGAEFHAPLLLHQHANVVRVRHHYQGDTGQFARYLHLLVPPSLDVPVDMARRTTFLVLDRYPLTLQTFVDNYWKSKDLMKHLDNKAQAQDRAQAQEVLGSSDFREQTLQEDVRQEQQFLMQVAYQLLSAVDYFQRHEVVHRDIKADNVFLDWRLRPVLGDFGLARTLRGHGGQPAPFTDRCQVLAGNSHAWAPELCRWSRVDPSMMRQPIMLKDIYSKSDGYAVARMFYHLFHRPQDNNDHTKEAKDDISSSSNSSSSSGSSKEEWFPTSTLQQPHYPDSAVRVLQGPVCAGLAHVLRALVLDNPADRPSVRQALCRVGVLMFKPEVMLRSVEEAEEFFTSQLLQLSALPPDTTTSRPSQPEEETLSMAESVAANQNHCLADFLLNFSGEEFWEAYTEMMRMGF